MSRRFFSIFIFINLFFCLLSYVFFVKIILKNDENPKPENSKELSNCDNETTVMQNEISKLRKLASPFQSCKQFYVDLGSNVGVQVRKLYQPELYPEAAVLPIFEQYFGSGHHRRSNKQLCSVGFEMNPKHTERLKLLESFHVQCNFRTFFYTETAVASYDGSIPFWSDHDVQHHEWGASTVHNWNNDTEFEKVNCINISRFFHENILPFAESIVVKLDIEGQELNVIPSLLTYGVLCNIDTIFLESHEHMMPANDKSDYIDMIKSLSSILNRAGCKTRILYIDDESYIRDDENNLESCLNISMYS